MGSTKKIIENNTIVNNSSYAGGGAISIESATNVILHNNIVWENIPVATQIKIVSSTPQITYCDIQGVYAGTGNINTNPQLDSSCYSLGTTSPCIDTGDTAVINNDLTSVHNVALFPSLGMARNDMGAYGGPRAF